MALRFERKKKCPEHKQVCYETFGHPVPHSVRNLDCWQSYEILSKSRLIRQFVSRCHCETKHFLTLKPRCVIKSRHRVVRCTHFFKCVYD